MNYSSTASTDPHFGETVKLLPSIVVTLPSDIVWTCGSTRPFDITRIIRHAAFRMALPDSVSGPLLGGVQMTNAHDAARPLTVVRVTASSTDIRSRLCGSYAPVDV